VGQPFLHDASIENNQNFRKSVKENNGWFGVAVATVRFCTVQEMNFVKKQLFYVIALDFAVRPKDVVAHRHEQHFGAVVFLASREKTAKRVILLDPGKGSPRLDRAVRCISLRVRRGDFFACVRR